MTLSTTSSPLNNFSPSYSGHAPFLPYQGVVNIRNQANNTSPKVTTNLEDRTNELARRILAGTSAVVLVGSFVATILASSTYAWGVVLGFIIREIGERVFGNSQASLNLLDTPPSQTNNTSTDSAAPSYCTSSIRRHYAPFVPGQPVGIPRSGTMNCWAIALMQFARNIPSLYSLIQNQSDKSLEPLRAFYAAYENARYDHQHVVNNPSSQTIRQCLHRLNSLISIRPRQQEDAHEGLMPIMNNFVFPYLQSDRPGRQNIASGVISLSIAQHANRSISDLLEQEYMRETDSHGGANLRFRNKPDDLFIHIPRFQLGQNGRYTKNCDAINITPTLDIGDRLVVNGTGGKYECDSFIVHQGSGMDAGHYVAYIKVGDTWWLCDDDMVTTVQMNQVQSALRESYLLHYRAL